MDNNETSVLAKGFFFERPKEGAPAWVKGKLGIKVEDAIGFLRENTNDAGYCNLDLLLAKDGQKLYLKLNNWKPEAKKETEYPEGPNPEDVPW